MLVEYEQSKAHLVEFTFRNAEEAAEFQAIADAEDAVAALRKLGRLEEARRVVINTIILGMVSDCMHHVFEALRCMERRKVVVAFNLLRKPLTDNLIFLSWMLGDEEGFYQAFTTQSPQALTTKGIGNRRGQILAEAHNKTELQGVVDPAWIESTLCEASNKRGLYWIFQRAVHLITFKRDEVRTEPENFNFIFKSHAEDDSYEGLYEVLPTILLFLSHVIAMLFDRMHPMDEGGKAAFRVRTIYGFHLVEDTEQIAQIRDRLLELGQHLACTACKAKPKMTRHNMARLVLSESFRCTSCGRINLFPFAWLF
jgi:hypothetical protein